MPIDLGIHFISVAAGGNVASALLKNISLGISAISPVVASAAAF